MSTISKKGFIVENNNGKVKVMIQRDSGCGSCSTCGGCEIKPLFLEIDSALDLKSGDQVYLDSDYSFISRITKFIYLFPVIMTLLGAILAHIIFKGKEVDKDLMTFVFIIIFFSLSIFIINKIDKKHNGKKIIRLRKI